MPARAMWKGVLRVGTQRVPVKLFSALVERGIHFRLLERRTKKPVKQQLIDPSTDEVVAFDAVTRGFAVPEGYVRLTAEELDGLAPKPSRDVTVSGFVPETKLSPEWLIRPYYLGPDGDTEAYFALARALEETGRQGIAHWVMRNHDYTGVLCARDGYLMLITLRHADEVIDKKDLPEPKGRAHTERELEMAEQLLAAYEDAFDPNAFEDEYRERVLAFVAQKAKGKKPRLKKPAVKRGAEDLSVALEKSLSGLRRKERHVA